MIDPADPNAAIVYPLVEPNHTGRLRVPSGHEIYYEEVGNPKGTPALYLHGGPGAGLPKTNFSRRHFNPEKFRTVLFDQRGCYRSTPFGSVENNTTQDLIFDIEMLRIRLKIDRWVIHGGSWGSGLALAYAEAFPTRIRALVLRGVFLLRESELAWQYQEGGASNFYPQEWQEFLSHLEPEERADPLHSYHQRIHSTDEAVAKDALLAWARWEQNLTTLVPNQTRIEELAGERLHQAQGTARMETHYYVNHCFLEEDQLLRDAHRITDIPCTLVQGRHDMVCPPNSAWDLHQVLPRSSLVYVEDGGHAATHEGIAKAVVEALDSYAD